MFSAYASYIIGVNYSGRPLIPRLSTLAGLVLRDCQSWSNGDVQRFESAIPQLHIGG